MLLWACAVSTSAQSYYGSFRSHKAATGGTPKSARDYVDASNEDHEEKTDGTASGSVGDITSSDLELGNDGSVAQNFGVYFDSLNIAAGATIDSAFIQFTVDNTSISDPLVVDIYAQEGSTPAVFAEVTNNILNRDRTETKVTWTLTGGTWSPVGNAGPDQRTPNLASIIQEAVDNGSYSQGDPIVILFWNTDGGERECESFDGTAAPWIDVYWKE